jgi:hypothetical protein
MQYKDVVKAMFAKHSGKMAPKDIMKMAAAEYRKMKGTGQMHSKRMSRGGGVISDVANPIVGMADSLGSLFGLGLDEGKGMKKTRGKRMPRGGGVIGDLASPVVNIADSLGSLFGLGLDEGKGMKKTRGKRMPRGGGVIGDLANPVVGIADSLGSLFGLGLDEGKGMMKKGRKRMSRGGYMSAGALSAGDIEPQAMTPGDGAFAMVPMNPRVLSNNAMGGNILNSVSRFLPYMALLA